jgi:hypothetical protein
VPIHQHIRRTGAVLVVEGVVMSRRRGFSKIDLLIAVLILVLVVGILLPFIPRHREQGYSRSASSNHLKQVVLAVHMYVDTHHGTLPPLVDVGDRAPTGAGLQSLFFHLLPYVEEDKAYLTFNALQPDSYFNKTEGTAQIIIQTYISPADATALGGTIASEAVRLPEAPPAPFSQTFTGWYATTSYAANGLFVWNKDGFPRNVKDGTSNTLMFAERPQVCVDTASGTTVYNLWGYGVFGPSVPAFALLTPEKPEGLPSTGQVSPVLPLSRKRTSEGILVRVGRQDAVPQQALPRPFLLGLMPGGPCDSRLAGSPHSGGMLVALADGSVRSIAPTISDWSFWAACTPAGDETPQTDWGY